MQTFLKFPSFPTSLVFGLMLVGYTLPSQAIEPTVSVGANHLLALLADGSLYLQGNNNLGQLGDGTYTFRYNPIKIPGQWQHACADGDTTTAIRSDGSLWMWGSGAANIITRVINLPTPTPTRLGHETDWDKVFCRNETTLALKRDGSLWGWGHNPAGLFGMYSTANQPEPIRIGIDSDWQTLDGDLAIKRDGSLWMLNTQFVDYAWIYEYPNKLGAQRVGTDNDWKMIARGTYHALLLKNDGSLWGWGRTSWGEVIDDPALTTVSKPKKIGDGYTSIAAGEFYSLAVKADGSLQSWGQNQYGALGNGSLQSQRTPTTIDGGYLKIANNTKRALGLKHDGSLHVWGGGDLPDQFVSMVEYNAQPSPVSLPDSRGVRFEPMTTGTSRNLTLNGRITPAAEDIGQSINIYLAWIRPDGTLQLSNGQQYVNLTGGPLPVHQTVNATQSINVEIQPDSADFRSHANTLILLGYGRNEADMLTRQQYRAIYRVPYAPPNN